MLKYKLKSSFEYITLKTPILSILLASVTFFAVFTIAYKTKVNEYMIVTGQLLGSDTIVYVMDNDREYINSDKLKFWDPENEAEKYDCKYVREENNMIYFEYKGLYISDNRIVNIEIVDKKISLLNRMLGDFIE